MIMQNIYKIELLKTFLHLDAGGFENNLKKEEKKIKDNIEKMEKQIKIFHENLKNEEENLNTWEKVSNKKDYQSTQEWHIRNINNYKEKLKQIENDIVQLLYHYFNIDYSDLGKKSMIIEQHDSYTVKIIKYTLKPINSLSVQEQKKDIKNFVEKISNNSFDLHNPENIEGVKKDLRNIGASDLIKKITDLINLFNAADKDDNLNDEEKQNVKDKIILSLNHIIKHDIFPFFTYDINKELSTENLLPILMAILLATNISIETLNKAKSHLEGSKLTSDLGETGCLSNQIYNAIDFLTRGEKKPAETPSNSGESNLSSSSSSLSSTTPTPPITPKTQTTQEKKSLLTAVSSFFGGLLARKRKNPSVDISETSSASSLSDDEQSDVEQSDDKRNLEFYSGF